MKSHAVLLITLFFCATAAGQVRDAPPSPPTPTPTPLIKVDLRGQFDGQRYVNEGFGFEVNLPEGWEFQNQEVNEKFAETASQKGKEFNAPPKAAEQSMSRTKILFIAIRPTNTRTNPIVLGMAEDVALAFNIRSARQYIEAMRLITNERSPIIFGDRITDETINGVEFSYVGASARDPNVMADYNIRQRYYVTFKKTTAIAFIITYHSPDELNFALEMLKTVKFK